MCCVDFTVYVSYFMMLMFESILIASIATPLIYKTTYFTTLMVNILAANGKYFSRVVHVLRGILLWFRNNLVTKADDKNILSVQFMH